MQFLLRYFLRLTYLLFKFQMREGIIKEHTKSQKVNSSRKRGIIQVSVKNLVLGVLLARIYITLKGYIGILRLSLTSRLIRQFHVPQKK